MSAEVPSATEQHEHADPLDALRVGLDDIDRIIVGLVGERTRLTLAIAAEKQRRGLPTMAPGRHSEVVTNYMAAAEDGTGIVSGEAAASLALKVMEISRDAQDRFRSGELRAAEGDRQKLAALAEEAAARLNGE